MDMKLHKLANEIKAEVKSYVESASHGLCLAVVQVGNDPASTSYIKRKKKDCEECGIEFRHIHLDENITQDELMDTVSDLNCDENVTGFIVQLPLPSHIDENEVLHGIDPNKDVDGLSPLSPYEPCTPKGIMEIFSRLGLDLVDTNVTVIGAGHVGAPLAQMLTKAKANVTVLHSKTSEENKRKYCLNSDVIIVATGHPNSLTANMTPALSFIVDVGINRDENGKLFGDAEKAVHNLEDVACTAVPGGVGLMTRAALLQNVVEADKRRDIDG